MNILIILHIVTTVFIIGPMAILPHSGLGALRRNDPKTVRGIERSTTIFAFLSLLVFMLGFGALGVSDKYSFSDGWLMWSIVLYIIALGLTLFVVLPELRRGAEGLEAGETAAEAGYGKIAAANGITTLLLVLVVVLMAWRP